MSEPFADVRLTETVISALRLAATRRQADDVLETQSLLISLAAADHAGDWASLLIDDRPRHDPGRDGNDTWEGVPLSQDCSAALELALRIAEHYDLLPLPPGVLALALASDPASGAAQSFAGIGHEQVIETIQTEILGIELEGVRDFLPTDKVVTAGIATPESPQADPRRPQTVSLTESQIAASLRHVITGFPRWLFALLTAVAIIGTILGIVTSPAWRFHPVDDLTPPLTKPAITSAIPTDAEISEVLELDLVRVGDGRPRMRLFDSSVPSAYDIRTQAIDGAWATHWDSVDGSTEVEVEVVSQRYDKLTGVFTNRCSPSDREKVTAPLVAAGFTGKSDAGAAYCSFAFYRRAQIVVFVDRIGGDATGGMPAQVASIQSAIQRRIPTPSSAPLMRIPSPYASAQLNRGLLLVIVGVPLLWLLPTLLFDRGTWQRFWWMLSLKRFRSLAMPGTDIDPFIRPRLWASAAQASTQVCAAIWVLRLSKTWGSIPSALAVVASVLAVTAIPRILYLRRVGRDRVFAGARRIFWLLGIVSVVAGTAFAVFVMILANTMANSVSLPEAPDYAVQRVSLMLKLLALPVALVALLPMMIVRRLAMRAMRSERNDDDPPPILLLRSFADDGRRLRGRSSHRRGLPDRLSLRRWERFEEVIAASLGAHGPVLAAGQPGERLPPPLGAVRRQFTSEEWQDRVYELMSKSSIICVTLGRSAALSLEISRIANLGFLPKTIFVLPPTNRREHLKRLAVLASALGLEWAHLNIDISGSWCLAVRVSAVGAQPQVFRARAQEDIGYDIALELARLAVAGLDIQTPPVAAELQRPRPAPEVFGPGKAPVFKPVLRRTKIWLAAPLFSSPIAALIVMFLYGETAGDFTAIRLSSGYSAWAVAADPDSNVVFSVINGTQLGTIDFKRQTGDPICKIEQADHLVASHGWVFGWDQTEGTLEAVNVSEKRVVWVLRHLSGVRSVVATADMLYVVLPADKEVRSVDRATGKTITSTKVDGTPWAAVMEGNSLYVSLIDAAEVLILDKDSLTVTSKEATPSSPSQLAVGAGSIWVYSVTQHSLTALKGPARGHVIWTRAESPHVSSNGRFMVIEGIEQVTVVWPSGVVRRSRLTTRHALELEVLNNGDVVAMVDDQFVLIM